MATNLKEVNDILGREDEDIQLASITHALQALLHHQVIYDDTHGVPGHVIALIRQEARFFDSYFNVMGYRLRIENHHQMIALEPLAKPYGASRVGLKKDDTLVRLALRLILDEGFKHGAMDEHGRVTSDTDELYERFHSMGQISPPPDARLNEILKDLARLGAVKIGDRDRQERVTALKILPGLRVYVSDGYIAKVNEWIEQGCPGEFFEYQATQAANDRQTASDIDEEEDSNV
jgi:hypothetical protein